MQITVIELLISGPIKGFAATLYAKQFTRQYVSIMPQVISVWLRRLGHDVHYATYYGQEDPLSMIPDDTKFVFIASYTKNSSLAYALSHLLRQKGITTIIGGPHAKAFPDDCLKYFDFVVIECDEALVKDIVNGAFDKPQIISSAKPPGALPGIQERMPEIRIASFDGNSPSRFALIPMLASIGCPYDCNFCIDWDNPYTVLPQDQYKEDLQYLSTHHPDLTIGYHDPNFGVRFDETMEIISSIPRAKRNPYVMESSLSILKENRLNRLTETNCIFVLPGVESWSDYSGKAGAGTKTGAEKVEKVVAHLESLGKHVQGIQANLIFGTDVDAGETPVSLTENFIKRLPGVWPAINIPIPYGGTPLTETLRADGRILEALPFIFYRNPFLTFQLANYSSIEYYQHWIRLRKFLMSPKLLARRMLSNTSPRVKGMNFLRTLSMRSGYVEARDHLRAILSDRELAAFHRGESAHLPQYYHRAFDATLGPYASVLSRETRAPLLTNSYKRAATTQTIKLTPPAAQGRAGKDQGRV